MDLDKIRKGIIDLEDKIIESICRRENYKKNLFIYECNSKELKNRYKKKEIKGIESDSYNFEESSKFERPKSNIIGTGTTECL